MAGETHVITPIVLTTTFDLVVGSCRLTLGAPGAMARPCEVETLGGDLIHGAPPWVYATLLEWVVGVDSESVLGPRSPTFPFV